MGVKDLWTIISPICERKSLWEFQDKCIAIDLSCWICDSQNVTDNRAQPNMYLRLVPLNYTVFLHIIFSIKVSRYFEMIFA